MSQQLQTHLIAAAIGATIGVISAASIFIYQKVLEKQQHNMKNAHLDEVDRRLTELQEELERLRTQQNQQRKKKKKQQQLNRKHDNDSTCGITDDTDVDYSTAGTDIGEDEFFDCSDSENGISDIENGTEATRPGLDFSVFDADRRGHEEDDYFELQMLANTFPHNVDVMWRFGRSCYMYSRCATEPDVKKAVVISGIKACEELLKTARNVDLYKWCAILVGIYGDFLPISEKIQNGFRFKEHIEKGLEIRPNDPNLNYLMGRFKYEVANLSWIERKIAATLFTEPPSASYEDAIENFLKSEQIASEVNLENKLFLSKCYIALSEYKQACHWLEKICNSPFAKEEEIIYSDACELLDKYSKYCQ